MGSASTGLATQVYDDDLDFETMHTQFSVPVFEDEEDYDNLDDVECDTRRNMQKTDLINAADVLIIDEFFSSHKYVVKAILKSYNNLKGKILIVLMDRGQTPPVVKNGSRSDVVNSTILKLDLWATATKYSFSINLRLLFMSTNNPNDEHYQRQKWYAKVLSEIRTNGPYSAESKVVCLLEDTENGVQKLVIPGYKYRTNIDEALNFLYPQGFNTPNFDKGSIGDCPIGLYCLA